MDKNVDIGRLLNDWPFDPDSNIRHIRAADGREKLQVRVEQGPFRGILQMDLEGRPDGDRPHGHDFALDFYVNERDQVAESDGSFQLDRQMCEELFDESRQVYERYAFLLQLADFERVMRDTSRNMRLFRFVNTYAEHPDDRDKLERWWPYILRIYGTAKAMLALRHQGAEQAIKVVDSIRHRIHGLDGVDAVEYRLELDRSLEALEELETELQSHLEPTPRQKLEQELAKAVEDEAYERAADLRDQLRDLTESELAT